jgi:hypothetical protein
VFAEGREITEIIFWDSEELLLVVIMKRGTKKYVNTLKKLHSWVLRMRPRRRKAFCVSMTMPGRISCCHIHHIVPI